MLTLQIPPWLEESLRSIAERKHISPEIAAEEALQNYIREQSAGNEPEIKYSFIGIAHSGKGNLSVRAEEILNQASAPNAGGRLPQ